MAASYLELRRGRRACVGVLLVIEKNAERLYSNNGSRVAVGLEFGTTFLDLSTLTFRSLPKRSHPTKWPQQSSGDGQPYCKTQTSLYYLQGLECRS